VDLDPSDAESIPKRRPSALWLYRRLVASNFRQGSPEETLRWIAARINTGMRHPTQLQLWRHKQWNSPFAKLLRFSGLQFPQFHLR